MGNGGLTELTNLISLCHFHHHSVHEGGWNIEATDAGWRFVDPHGNVHAVPVLRLPTSKPLAESDANSKNGTAAPLAGTGESVSTSYVADILISNGELRRQRVAASS